METAEVERAKRRDQRLSHTRARSEGRGEEHVRFPRFSASQDGKMDKCFVRFPGEGSVERADTTRRARRRAGSEHYRVATRHQILGTSGRSDEKGRRRSLAAGSRENSRRCAQQASR